MDQTLSLLLLLGLSSAWSFAAKAPSCGGMGQGLANAPLCPAGGGLLPDLYPTAAVTVSDIDGGAEFVQEVVEKILATSPDSPPMILLNVSSANMEKLNTHVAKIAKTPEQKQKWLATLTRLNTKVRANWQQDFYQDFANPKTGKPEVRYVTGYERRGENTKAIFKQIGQALSQCGGSIGKALPFMKDPEDGTPVSGAYGGNLESAPGFCMVGSDHFTSDAGYEKYVKAVCGTRPHLKPPTTWLEVGHTDEIFKAIPVPNRPAPCNVAYIIASPRKARELFTGAHAKESAFQLKKKMKTKGEARDFFWATEAFDLVCSRYLTLKASELKKPPTPRPASSASDVFSMLEVLPQAHAEKKKKPRFLDPTDDPLECQNMTNEDLIAADDESQEFNDLVQTELDQFQEQVRAQIKATTPQCEPDIIEVPSLFTGGVVKGKKGKPNRLAKGFGSSLFPNPTNSVLIAPTMISPEPYNATIKAYLDAEYKKRGLTTEYVDTMFAHQEAGNLHCSTQTIRYCKPGVQ